MYRTAAIATLLATAALAHAQARYEIGYQFDDEPEVVRVESEPFFVSARRDPPPEVFQILYIGNRTTGRTPSFNVMDAQINTAEGDDDARSTTLRSAITYNDLVFAADESGEIAVGFQMFSGGLLFSVPHGTEYAGIEYRRELTVEVNDQQYTGEAVVTLTGDSDAFSARRSGILVGESSSQITIENILVPTNEPVTLRIEIAKAIRRPQGVAGRSMHLIAMSPDTGFPADGHVFVVPEGVRVDSVQAEIFDNHWIPCRADVDRNGRLDVFDFLAIQNLFDAGDLTADFDGDGALTIFDFLAFQNAFDAGCP